MPVLLLAETRDGHLDPQTARALTAALQIDREVHILVAGDAGPAAEAARLAGVARVLSLAIPLLAEPLADAIVALAPAYGAILAPATSTGKNVLPRVAALLDVMQVSDIIGVVAPDTFRRPVYAGNAIETVQSTDPIKVVTVRASAFPAAAEGGTAPIEVVPPPATANLSRIIGSAPSEQPGPQLSSARAVVSGGRAFGSKEQFDALLGPLADALGAAIGASRAAVDAGYAANDRQVGQTGKVVAPDLYIACGISGAIQHLAGMKASKVVVAIDSDPSAPIFSVADYGLVGDIFALLPELTAALRSRS